MQNNILKWAEFLKGIFFTVCLFVCPLIFLTDTTQNPFVVQPLFLSISGCLFILACLFEAAIKKTINLKFSKVDFALIIFLLCLVVSLIYNYFFTPYQTALLNEFARKADYLFLGLLLGFLLAKITNFKIDFTSDSYDFFKKIFFWCLLWLLWKVQANAFIAVLIFTGGVYICFKHLKNYGVKECFDILLAVCFCACLYGLLQACRFDLFFRNIDITKEFGIRPVSTFGNPNFLASFTLLCLPYSLLLFSKAKGIKQNLISGLVILVLALFLTISGTRSAWLGLLGSGAIFLIISPGFRQVFKNKILKVFVLTVLFILCLYGSGYLIKTGNSTAPLARISETKQALKSDNIALKTKELIAPLHQRLMMWHCALENFKDNPLLGKGLNSFQLYYPFCQSKLIAQNPALDRIKIQANAAHNEYLEILSEGGIITFLAYITFWVLFFTSVVKKLKDLNQDERVFYVILLLGIIGVLLDNTLNITLRTLLLSLSFWFTVSVLNNLNTASKTVKFKFWLFMVVFISAFIVFGGTIFVQLRQFSAQKYELQGYKYLVNGDYKNTIAEMEKAIQKSSFRPEPFYVLVNVNMAQNNLDEAIKYADRATQLYPAYYEIYFRLATLHNAENKTESALNDLRKTLALLPTYTPAAELYANILSNQKNVPEADKLNLIKLSEILPFQINLTSYLAEIYFKENNCAQAFPFAVYTLQNNMFDKTALNILLACPKNRDEELFAEDVKQINELKTHIKNKQDLKILWDLETLLNNNPQDFWLSNLLAEYYFRQGNFCKAKEILKEFQSKEKSNKAYIFALANATEKCGNIQEAQQLFQDVLSLDPYDEFATNRLKNVNI